MCVCTNPGITAQPDASITVSAVATEAPTSAMRSSRMRRSPRTIVFAASIVTSVPFLMRIDDIFYERTIEQVRKGGLPPHIDEQGQATLPNLFYSIVLEITIKCKLLRGRFYGFRLFSHRKAELHLHVALNLAQDFGIIFQRLLRVFPSLAQALAFIRKPGATLFHRTLDHR